PDRGLHRFDLAEEWADAGKGVVSPVLQQSLGFGRHFPIGRIGDGTPVIDGLTDFVDARYGIVFLIFGREPETFIQEQLCLCAFFLTAPLARLGDRCEELRTTTLINDLLSRLSGCVQLPMPAGVVVWRIEDGLA